MYAASSGSADAIRVLLDAGAEVNETENVCKIFAECEYYDV